ncbi:MAG: roadblock/LC7 domain-containing protein [candidate division Zixibacteria bacterium]
MKTAKQNKFQTAVEYLTDYSGVKCALIADSDGLIIISSPAADFDGELCAAVGLDLVDLLDKNLRGIAESGCEFLTVKTGADWITIAKTSIFYLIVIAERKADDLLGVRISRALEMISSYMKEKYPAVLLSSEPAARKIEKKTEVYNV